MATNVLFHFGLSGAVQHTAPCRSSVKISQMTMDMKNPNGMSVCVYICVFMCITGYIHFDSTNLDHEPADRLPDPKLNTRCSCEVKQTWCQILQSQVYSLCRTYLLIFLTSSSQRKGNSNGSKIV